MTFAMKRVVVASGLAVLRDCLMDACCPCMAENRRLRVCNAQLELRVAQQQATEKLLRSRLEREATLRREAQQMADHFREEVEDLDRLDRLASAAYQNSALPQAINN